MKEQFIFAETLYKNTYCSESWPDKTTFTEVAEFVLMNGKTITCLFSLAEEKHNGWKIITDIDGDIYHLIYHHAISHILYYLYSEHKLNEIDS